MRKKFAVFASGNGSNLQAIIDAVKSGQIKADLALVFSDKQKAYALERARTAGIPILYLDIKAYADKQSFERDIVMKLKGYKIDFIVLAGYMKLFTEYFIHEYPNKILNVHPSMLPLYKGMESIKEAFAGKAKSTGVTVHFVDEKMDHGPIILQEAVPIETNDTLEILEAKVHAVEHKIYPHVIALFAEDKIRLKNGKVEIEE